MTNETIPTSTAEASESSESFGEMLAQFEHTHSHKAEGDPKQMEGIVVSKDAGSVYLDIGFKTEGILPRAAFDDNAEEVAVGAKLPISVKGRNLEGYYELSRIRVAVPTGWGSLEEAFASRSPVAGIVTALVKGGFTVDVGVRAFMPASRSGVRDAAEMEKLVGQQIACRIIKLDTTEEDIVVDRRVLVEEEARALEQTRYAALSEGDIVTGQVRSLASYGAFIDLGAIDGLLHIGDIAWTRVNAPEDILSVGQQLRLKILKIEPESRRISLSLKQLEPEPWLSAAERYSVGQRTGGTVTRLMDFGAFVELEPGIEGLIHVSEMSWIKKVRKPSDMLNPGDTVDAVILSVSPAERRISLGLKQALGDPWLEVPQRFPVGSEVEGPVIRMMKFGAFVELTEGVEGLVHVSEIAADRHIHHPQDVLRTGQRVKAQVLAIEPEKRQIKLSIKQLIPTGLNEYLAEHNEGDLVSGCVLEASPDSALIELGEGIRALCSIISPATPIAENPAPGAIDISALTSMLKTRWKTGPAPAEIKTEALAIGQVRSFRLKNLDRETQKIDVEIA